jgi:hypothetical protein
MLNWHADKPYYYCNRLRLVEHLRNRGFYPLKTLPDFNNPRYNVWMYENSPELADAVEEFLINQQNRQK